MKRLVLTTFLLLFCMHVFSQNNAVFEKTPAAWAWSITSEEKRIFLLGEFHVFAGISEDKIDFELGEYLFKSSEIMYKEADKIEAFEKINHKKLSELLGLERWKKLEDQMRKTVSKINRSDSSKDALLKNLMEELDRQSPVFAEGSIRYLSTQLYVRDGKNVPITVAGLAERLSKKNALSFEKKKIFSVEENYSIDKAWLENCNSSAPAQQLIDAALSTFDHDNFWSTSKVKDQQDIFRDYYSARDGEEKFMKHWLDNYPASAIFLKCNVAPRNMAWAEKIRSLLSSPGQDVTVIVGAAHLFGENGLIKILQRDDSYKIERIYTVADVEKTIVKR
jgi:uncharacterized protein YbaP (TraB family)